ncbi:MAG: hypothetical protein A3C53_05925 [Omnitrophica WOR_2 bacterium RIFCSPHIGHO2_02_FULL_68_15]|nr:MAG: hypothetical protein A3C53_05925 [Omnitrophica WOR_2 bacterium RIFCSPHIGHO2_02_FULL_68_15]
MPLPLIPLLPLAAFLLNILVGRRLGAASAWVSVAAVAGAAALSVRTFLTVAAGHAVAWPAPGAGTWLPIGGDAFRLGLVADPMSATMLLVVTGIGALITLYSIGYMHGDPRYSRFFAYLSLFTAAMLLLLLADHFLLLFVGWELVGLCSYLLISFWFENPAAADAGKKAFLTTRLGDAGFLLGLFLLYTTTGTLRFSDLAAVAHDPSPWLGVAAVLLFCGAVGKSAQFPLHVWLPDAMEGPTPVSALIHAATMVAAGVYLVARTFVLFEHHPAALQTVAVIGGITAFGAATIAVTQTDIKRVLAYSTISQLGLMMLGLGVGSTTAGFFHLVTHACFKALLFLGAGSVIHGAGAQEVGQLGGLWRTQRVTAVTFLIATLAIAGVPPLAGFWSKDELLAAALHHGHGVLFLVGAATSALTAFYMGRLFLLTFAGTYRGHGHPHESPAVMTVPLALLAVASVVVGLPGSPWGGHAFQRFLGEPHPPAPDLAVMAFSTVIAALGLAAAGWRYGLNRPLLPAGLRAALAPWQRAAAHTYYVDELYDRWIIRPVLAATRGAFRADQRLIDGAVNLVGTGTLAVSRLKRWVDAVLVDGAVNGTAALVGGVGSLARRLQTGVVQHYLLLAAAGAALALAVALTRGGL